MPYYIYHVFNYPILRLKKIEQHEEFRVASNRAKTLRSELEVANPRAIKVIFAENELGAEDMLSQVREAAPGPGDD